MNRKQKIILFIGIIFIAFNLRAPITSVGPLANTIKDYFEISNSATGFITTLPLMIFALVSPFVSRISLKLGNGLTMFIGLVLLVIGEVVRSYTGLYGLFIGTILIASGICVGNVLIPSIIKQVFPNRIGFVTSIYTPVMSVFAAIASGISIPLATGMNIGWKNALSVWLILAIATLIIWLPQLRKQSIKIATNPNAASNISSTSSDASNSPIWKSSLAWYVTIFMGLQSILFYCSVAWLPSILQTKGINSELAGYMLMFFQMIAVPASFFVSQIADKLKSQQILAAITSSSYLSGMIVLFLADSTSMVYVCLVLLGIGSGSSVSIALSFMGLRTTNAKDAARLSGMAQSIGYIFGASGPLLIGSLYDRTGSFTAPLIFLIIVGVLQVIASFGAGQNKRLFENNSINTENIDRVAN